MTMMYLCLECGNRARTLRSADWHMKGAHTSSTTVRLEFPLNEKHTEQLKNIAAEISRGEMGPT